MNCFLITYIFIRKPQEKLETYDLCIYMRLWKEDKKINNLDAMECSRRVNKRI